jgi:hypothetical protein
LLQKGKRVPRQTVESHREAAELLAVEALAYLAGEPERLGRFLALTGILPDTIRAAARDPGFLAAVLDHIAGDERLLVAFAGERGCDPAEVARARKALSGPDWDRGSA